MTRGINQGTIMYFIARALRFVAYPSHWLLELGAVVYLIFFMLIFAYSILISPGVEIYRVFSRDFHTVITPVFFIASFVSGAVCSVLLLVPHFRKFSNDWKRNFYWVCAFPLMLYTFPLGWYVAHQGGSLILSASLMALFFGYILIGTLLYCD